MVPTRLPTCAAAWLPLPPCTTAQLLLASGRAANLAPPAATLPLQVNKEVAKDSKEAAAAAAEAEAAAAAKKQAGLDAVLASLQQAKKVGGCRVKAEAEQRRSCARVGCGPVQ